jgi:hypothetical protein
MGALKTILAKTTMLNGKTRGELAGYWVHSKWKRKTVFRMRLFQREVEVKFL